MQTFRLMLVAVLVGSGALFSGCAKEEKKPATEHSDHDGHDHSSHEDHSGHDH
jgi:hypothetical protein